MTDKPDYDEAWLYAHHEFGREVHLTRFDAETGGTSDDYIGWAETRLVPEASQPDASALVAALKGMVRALDMTSGMPVEDRVAVWASASTAARAALTAWEAQHG